MIEKLGDVGFQTREQANQELRDLTNEHLERVRPLLSRAIRRHGRALEIETRLESLLAFLSVGHTHLGGAHRETVAKAIDFLLAAQNPGTAWRYSVRPGDNDTSVTGWAVMALKSAPKAALRVPEGGFEGARKWLDAVTDNPFFRTGYFQRGDPGPRLATQIHKFTSVESCSAISLVSRNFMGAGGGDPLLMGQGDLLNQNLPRWEPNGGPGGESRIDFYYWYYGTLAMFQMGGDYWRDWNRAMKSALVPNQRKDGDERGSWDAVGAWGAPCGRIGTTALAVLSLEIYHRYPRDLE